MNFYEFNEIILVIQAKMQKEFQNQFHHASQKLLLCEEMLIGRFF